MAPSGMCPATWLSPAPRQNELHADHARTLIKNGVIAVGEGANMPTTTEATQIFQQNGILFAPARLPTLAGVATSALEMSQNSMRLSWTFDEVDQKLKQIMVNIFHNTADTAKQFGHEGDYVVGANIAGFMKVAKAMLAQGHGLREYATQSAARFERRAALFAWKDSSSDSRWI